MPPASLFIEHHTDGLAFYINGDLQFDTADEAVYHEYLVVPAIALAAYRFPGIPLRILIAGGGDGLAARDGLRFPQVGQIDLVDYSPEVLDLGRTVFQPYNQGCLCEDGTAPLGSHRLTVYTQDALDFVSDRPNSCYHAVICDFTYPTSPEDSRIYSQEWYVQLRRILHPGGIVSTNGVSPQNRTQAFWCLYQTLLSAGYSARPLQVPIPSFHRHGYGDWGFFLASDVPIGRNELIEMPLPSGLTVFQQKELLQRFVLSAAIAAQRHAPDINTLALPSLFYYLLNPGASANGAAELPTEAGIDFLALEETANRQGAAQAGLELTAIAQVWLEQAFSGQASSDRASARPDIHQLLPVQHRYHTPTMTAEWFNHLQGLLAEIDPQQLVKSLLDRASELPPALVRDLKLWSEKLRSGKPVAYLSEHMGELVLLLSVSLLMANLTAPDAVFAKGYSGGGYSSGYSGDGSYDGNFPWMGFSFTTIGGMWLWSLYRHRDD